MDRIIEKISSLPARISASQIQREFETGLTSLVTFKQAYDDHIEDLQNPMPYRPAFHARMSAIEIYIKLHAVVYASLLAKEYGTSYLDALRPVYSGAKPGFRVKKDFGHDVRKALEMLALMVEIDPIIVEKMDQQLQNCRVNWVETRYDTGSIPGGRDQQDLWTAFQGLVDALKHNNIECLDKIVA